MTPLSHTRYSTHPAFSESTTAAITRVSRKNLRALVWYHAVAALKVKSHRSRVVDPRAWKVDRLRQHASTVLHGIIRIVAEPDMAVIMAQYTEQSEDTRLQAAIAAAAVSAAATPVISRSRRSRAVDADADSIEDEDDDEEEDEAEGEQPGDSAASASSEDDEGEEGVERRGRQREPVDQHEDGQQDDGADVKEAAVLTATPPQRRGRHVKTSEQAANVPPTGAKKATTAPTASSTRHQISNTAATTDSRLGVFCIKCAVLHDVTEGAPDFCHKCGNRWGVLPATTQLSSPTVTTTTATTPTAATAPTPTHWSGVAQFRPPALNVTPQRRLPGLAPLDEKIIKLAREGKQHYTLADLLPLRAENPSTTTTAVLSQTMITFDPTAESWATAVGSAATTAKSAATRRRAINGFAEISEVIHFSLIGNIYVDRPDICWQLFHLLLLALDFTRERGWRYALDYIEVVRHKFYESPGGARGRHYLLIDSEYDMGVRDTDILFDIGFQAQGNNTVVAAPPSRPAATRSDTNDRKQQPSTTKTSETCRGYNAGTCSRPRDCRYLHQCSGCGAAGHPKVQCTASRKSTGTTASTPPPSASSKRGV
jgi:hypothetical protein